MFTLPTTSTLAARLAALGLAAIALAGCGKAPMPASVAAFSAGGASSVVGIPASYVPGQPVPGADGTPSLRSVDWPKVTHTASGASSDPVNLVVSGSERQVRRAFGAEGWVQADRTNVVSAVKMVKAALLDKPYATAPMSDLYLYNRKEDIALQKDGTSARNRDHLRVWKMPLCDHNGLPFWAIAATHDIAIKWSAGEALPTHEISPDIDAERALVVNDFMKSGQVKMRYQLQSLAPNFKGVNGGGDVIFSDGRVEILELNPLLK